jgi:hypothetical protein
VAFAAREKPTLNPLAVPQLNLTRIGRAAYWTEVQQAYGKVLEKAGKFAVVTDKNPDILKSSSLAYQDEQPSLLRPRLPPACVEFQGDEG